MVRIRLARVGLKRQASYRLVIIDRERQRDGKFIEIVGFYNPRTRPETIEVQEHRVLYWLSVGAQPSDSAEVVLKKNGTRARFERLRKGESIEALAAEAASAKEAAAPISPKTRYPAPVKSAQKADAVDEAAGA